MSSYIRLLRHLSDQEGSKDAGRADYNYKITADSPLWNAGNSLRETEVGRMLRTLVSVELVEKASEEKVGKKTRVHYGVTPTGRKLAQMVGPILDRYSEGLPVLNGIEQDIELRMDIANLLLGAYLRHRILP